MNRHNEFGQPVGDDVAGWSPRPFPAITRIVGGAVTLLPLAEEHIDALFAATAASGSEARWTYMAGTPAAIDRESFANDIRRLIDRPDGQSVAIIPHGSDAPLGNASLMRADPANGSIEVGSIMFSPALAGTRAATEAIYLLARYILDDLGYRRFEWKCDALNERSRRAAERFGFAYEGTFRQHLVYKGRNRDTAWFAMTDGDWAIIAPAYERWLDDANFDEAGTQQARLGDFIAAARAASPGSE